MQELIDLSIGNLDYIKRNARGKTKWLNVLQGTTPKDSKQWWDAVKSYRMGGWALAGNVGHMQKFTPKEMATNQQ